ncbi:MAG: glycoside hydrolase family 31 protein [Bacteroidales bacterium]|nr:glycoside hydrolase family 31 protein [Bacteroidales bacterium]
MQAQLPIMLNMSMCGLGYIHSDAGGFAMGEKDEELYTRWLQFACFSPILRPHGSGVPSEPIFYSEQTRNIVRDFMKLRYQLLPYIYTMAYQNSISGKPLLKPLFFKHPDDMRFRNYSEAYYFGDQMIVAPVFKPGQKTKKILLPEGDWYSFWDDQAYVGDQEIEVTVDLEKIPILVKSGSIIPMVPEHYTTDKYPKDMLILHYWPDTTESRYQLYEDDGESKNSILNDEYELTDFSAKVTEGKHRISVHSNGNKYSGKVEQRALKILVHNIETNPMQIVVNGKSYRIYNAMQKPFIKEVDAKWDQFKKQLIIGLRWDSPDLEIEF